MKYCICILVMMINFLSGTAQSPAVDSIKVEGKVTVIRDARIDVLGKKQYEINTAAPELGPRAAKGYRLMVISSNDRDLAMKVRAQLLQRFPEQKVYMAFQAPYIKIKFGNFVEKGDAERYKKMIKQIGIVSTNVYLVPETVEVKPDKDKDKEKDDDK
jgi:SPOR domain